MEFHRSPVDGDAGLVYGVLKYLAQRSVVQEMLVVDGEIGVKSMVEKIKARDGCNIYRAPPRKQA